MATDATDRRAPSRWEMLDRQADYWWTVYRRTWKASVFSSFVMPILYVVAMGVVLGSFITADAERLEGAESYLVFVVPGMIAAHAMQTAVGEVMWPVMAMTKWNKTYYGMIASPLRVSDVVAAHLLFVAFRIVTTISVFMLAMMPFGVYDGIGSALVAFGAQLLVGMAFAAPIYAFACGTDRTEAFGVIYRVGVIPMFLFSGAFFPIENLGPVLAWVARFTPLWHGVDLTRMLILGQADPGAALLHVVVLLTLVLGGWAWAVRRLSRRLVS